MVRGFRTQAIIAAVGIILCLLLVLTALPTGQERPAVGGTMIEGVTLPAGGVARLNLNPLFAREDAERDVGSLLFSGLTRRDGDGRLVADLATNWQASSDGTRYRFNLRREVTWHDGAPFTAADVLSTVALLKDPAFAGDATLAAPWQQVTAQAVDSATVEFSLPQAYAPFLGLTTLAILPAHLLASNPAALNQQPIGTGPYRLVSADGTPGPGPAAITLERYGRYHLANVGPASLPYYIQRLVFRFYPTTATLLTAYQQGEIDAISYVAPEAVAQLARQPGLTVQSKELGRTTFIFLNLREAIFRQKEVRQALLYALDRPQLVADALYGQGVVSSSPLLPSSGVYSNDLLAYAHDPAKAASLLDAAGWRLTADGTRRNPAGQPLSFTLLANADNPYFARMAGLIVRDLGAIGVPVTVTLLSRNQLIEEHLQARNFDAVLLGWQSLPYEPDPYSLWHSTQADDPQGINFAGWQNDQADRDMENGRQSSDPLKRAAYYADFQRIFADELPSLPLYYPLYCYATSSRVAGVILPAMYESSDRFRTLGGWYVKTDVVTTK